MGTPSLGPFQSSKRKPMAVMDQRNRESAAFSGLSEHTAAISSTLVVDIEKSFRLRMTEVASLRQAVATALLNLAYCLLDFRPAARLYVEVSFLVPLSAAFGWSPITPLSGQTLNAGHFWQPTTIAIGQRVTEAPLLIGRRKYSV